MLTDEEKPDISLGELIVYLLLDTPKMRHGHSSSVLRSPTPHAEQQQKTICTERERERKNSQAAAKKGRKRNRVKFKKQPLESFKVGV